MKVSFRGSKTRAALNSGMLIELNLELTLVASNENRALLGIRTLSKISTKGLLAGRVKMMRKTQGVCMSTGQEWGERVSRLKQNGRNYSSMRKWTILGLMSCMTLIRFVCNHQKAFQYSLRRSPAVLCSCSPFASSVFAPAVSFMDEDFHNTSTTLSSFAVSVYVLGYAVCYSLIGGILCPFASTKTVT